MLKAVYETTDEIPENLREYYAESDAGGYILSVSDESGYALENVQGLKSTLGKLKDRATKAEEGLKQYSAIGRSPQELAEALQQLESLRITQGEESEAISRMRAELDNVKRSARENIEQATAPIQSLADARMEQIKDLLIDSQLQNAIIEAGGNPRLLMPILKNEVRARTDEDGKVIVEIVDADGTPRVKGKDLAPMGFSDLVAERRNDPDLAVAFKANGHSGGGTTPDSTARQGGARREFTPEEVASMSLSEYRQAREQGLIPA
jgi:uncharacterized phage infection (PIP) family protein YhgE